MIRRRPRCTRCDALFPHSPRFRALGPSFTLSAVSAVVLGGTALAGGAGGALGWILGAIILVLIANVVFFAGLPYEYQDLAKGLIVLAALTEIGRAHV